MGILDKIRTEDLQIRYPVRAEVSTVKTGPLEREGFAYRYGYRVHLTLEAEFQANELEYTRMRNSAIRCLKDVVYNDARDLAIRLRHAVMCDNKKEAMELCRELITEVSSDT